MKPFLGNHECGIKMRSKLAYRKVEFQTFFGSVTPGPTLQGEMKGG